MTEPKPSPDWKERLRNPSRKLQWTINVGGVALILAALFGIPEMMGRAQARAVCEAIPVGSPQSVEREALEALRRRFKADHGTLFAVSFYPKDRKDFRSKDDQPTDSTTGAVILLFLGGFPVGREWCVLDLENGIVRAKRTFFMTDDYAYCDGDVRTSAFDCSGER